MSPAPLIEVIDDNPDIRRMLGLVLKSHGYEVRTHESGLAFLACERKDQARLLILDVRMPGMTGLELHRHLLAQGETYPVIFTSGECQPHESVVAQSSAPIAFLWKPFGTQDLLQAIEKGMAQLS